MKSCSNTFRQQISQLKKKAGSDWNDWRWQVRHSFNSLKEIESKIAPLNSNQSVEQVEDEYFTRVNPYYLSLVQDWSYKDPIVLQSIPHPDEIEGLEQGMEDPLNELGDMPVSGIVHRYPDRCLAIMTGFCVTLCRHCMRKRNWLMPNAVASKKRLIEMLAYIRRTLTIREVLITGGDPLLINLEVLDWFMGELRLIKHLEIIRIGTRVPVVIPQRINHELCSILAKHSPVWMATHFNHFNEITLEAEMAIENLLRFGIPVVNQTVLMKGVNDQLAIIKKLCTELVRIKIKPMYLFHGDPIRGTNHFRTGVNKGIAIMRGLRGSISSLCMPTFAIDLPNSGGKVPILPNYCVAQTEKGNIYRSYDGREILYEDL